MPRTSRSPRLYAMAALVLVPLAQAQTAQPPWVPPATWLLYFIPLLALFSLGSTGQVPDSLERVVNFLVSGMTLFAPYVVNKFASLFQGLPRGK
jgi:hypothetical protein